MKIAHKLGLLVGMLLAALFVSILVLAGSFRSVSGEYDDLLQNQVREGAQARVMQVEFKKQVQAFDRLLQRGSDPAVLKTSTATYKAQDKKVQELNRELLAQTDNAAIKASLTQFQTSHASLDAAYQAAYDSFIASGRTNGDAASRAIDGQDRWPTDLIDIIVSDSERNTTLAVDAQQDAASNRLRAIIVLSALLLVLASAAAAWVVRGIVRPVRALTNAALEAANDRLPRVVAEIGDLPADAPAPELAAFKATSRDELSELASALTTLQGSAVELAFEQRRNELANAETLVNLGRRNQSLLTRTLSYVTELERDERDSDTLAKLFRLDHLTTRIRRNAESMLVLAGAEQTRTWTKPVAMEDVLRAALSEIEDYTRVTLQGVDPARVHGGVAADLAHMIAELLENATRFSPETNQVHVLGRTVPFGYQLDIMDEGLGMSGEELALANRRIELAGQERPDTKVLGHHVVGRLARRRGIRVRLVPSPRTGVVAQLLVPQSLLSNPLPAEPLLEDEVVEVATADVAELGAAPVAEAPVFEAEPVAVAAAPVAEPVAAVTVLTESPRADAAPAPVAAPAYQATAPVAAPVAPAYQAVAPAAPLPVAQPAPVEAHPAPAAPAYQATAPVAAPVPAHQAAPAPAYQAAAPAYQATAPVAAPAYQATAPVPPAQPAPVAEALPAQRASALGAFFNADRNPAAGASAPAGADQSGLPSRRVRGANLPDLGDTDEIAVPRRDPSSIGRQLSGLQSSTARARHEAAAAQTGDHDNLGS